MIWHSSNDSDPEQRWLHGKISVAADEISRLQD